MRKAHTPTPPREDIGAGQYVYMNPERVERLPHTELIGEQFIGRMDAHARVWAHVRWDKRTQLVHVYFWEEKRA